MTGAETSAISSTAPSMMSVLEAQLVLEKHKASKKTSTSAKRRLKATNASVDKENALPVVEKDHIDWMNNPAWTDKLLVIIEENPRYLQAFRFKGGNSANSKGLSIVQMSRDIGHEIFEGSILLADEKIGNSVKNRINTLKRTYSAYKKKLGDTGHGLVIADRTAEIISGTPIYNVWQKMDAKFKWYKKLHALLAPSPVYDTSALANSVTPLNLSVLTTPADSQDSQLPKIPIDPALLDSSHSETRLDTSYSPPWNFSQMDADFDDDVDVNTPSSPPDTQMHHSSLRKTPSPTSSFVATATPKTAPQKRKATYEIAKELSDNYSNTKLEVERLRQEEKRARRVYEADNLLKVEQLKLQAQQDMQAEKFLNKERSRAHQLLMIEKQIELARITHAGPSNITNAPSYTL